MVTKIIACADIHIRNLRRSDEYKEQLLKFVDKCTEIANENGPENTRIVICGDLLHNKLEISSEAYAMASWLLRKLNAVCKTILVAGNHDLNMANLSRLDPLSTMISMCKFNNVFYIDRECAYQSDCIEDDNIVWCLYSSFDKLSRPNIDEARVDCEGKTFVGLFHGEIKNAKTDAGYCSEHGYEASYFDGLDFGILGHIHKVQEICDNGVPLVYCGSLVQQDFGENVSGHGFVVWDVENQEYETVSLDSDYGYYTFKIENENDLDKNNEKILNL